MKLVQGWKLITADDYFDSDKICNNLYDICGIKYHVLFTKTINNITLKIVADNSDRLALVFPGGDYITDSEENDLGRLMHYADEYLVNNYWRKCHEQSNFVDTYEMVNIDECKAAEIEKIKENQENAARAERESKIDREIFDIKVDVKRLIDRMCALESRGEYIKIGENSCLNSKGLKN